MIRPRPYRKRAVSTLLYGLCALWLVWLPWNSAAEPDFWAHFKAGNAVLIMRHSLAPGIGDPANFALDDCRTQRNLNDEGRAQAKRWRKVLQQRGIEQPRVFTSQWCRTRQTAEALTDETPEAMPALNSFFRDRSSAAEQTEAVRRFLRSPPKGQPIILVTHQVNISELADVYTQSNEGVFIAVPLSSNPVILGRFTP